MIPNRAYKIIDRIKNLRNFWFLIYFVFNVICANGQQIAKTGANDHEVETVANENYVAVWAVPAEQKVRPEDRVEKNNLVWTKKDEAIKVAGAGNEHVPFQVVITHSVPPGNRPKPASGFFIESSDLESESGGKISKAQINFYLEHYIMLTGKSSVVGATGYWPDALAPLKVPFTMAAQYNVVRNRPLWVDISIPPATAAGNYKGTITVTQNEKVITTLKLQVQVYNFSLPKKTDFISYMNISKGSLAGFYHKSDTSKQIDELTQTYYDFLYSHRMEPWFNDQLEPKVNIEGGKILVTFNDARYKYYLNTLNSNRVLLETFPSALKKNVTAKLFSTEFNQQVKSYLSQVQTYFKNHGWKDRLVFNSPIDEPNSREDYEQTREWAALVHDAAPGVPFLATESPVTDNPDWGTLIGYVNNFSIHGNALNSELVKKAIRQEQAKGGEMTWYISCDQTYPQPNYFIDAPALDLVMVPWITARYRMSGILYWALNFWSQTPNPWLNANTFISGFECSDGYILNGEGSLLYPGNYVKEFTGQPNVDGPVSSIRFELLREGIEDYEYLSLLKDLGDEKYADSLTKNMVIDVRAFSRNINELYTTRKEMATKLEQLSKK